MLLIQTSTSLNPMTLFLHEPEEVQVATTFYDGSDGVFVYAGFLIKFSIDPEKVNPKYVKYYCRSKQYNDWVQSFNTGSTRGNINAQIFGNMEIPLPERKQQDYLVSILEPIDEKIRNNKQVNDNLADLLQTIYQERFGNDILAVNQGVLSDICSYSRDKVAVPELNVRTYFSTENMLSGKAGSTAATSLPTTSQTTSCHKGDTLISNIRPYFKKIVYCEDKCWLLNRCSLLYAKSAVLLRQTYSDAYMPTSSSHLWLLDRKERKCPVEISSRL